MLDRFRIVATGMDHPECVAVGADGAVYAGGEAGQVYRIADDATAEEIAHLEGFTLGIALDGAGRVISCNSVRGQVVLFDSETGDSRVYSSGTRERPMCTPNFAAFDASGNLYVADSGEWDEHNGCIYRVSRDGSTQVWTDAASRFPNGCAVSPDGFALYVAESNLPGITRIPISSGGQAGAPEVFVRLPDTVPDGIAFDTEGALYVGCYRPDRIYRVTAEGDPTIFAEDPRGTVLAAPTNIAFSGADHCTLLVANLGRWHLAAVTVDTPGVVLHHPVIEERAH